MGGEVLLAKTAVVKTGQEVLGGDGRRACNR